MEPSSLSLRVGDVERDRAQSLLQEAYCAGRLDEVELDQRLGAVLTAQTRRDLNAALAGLPPRPLASPPMASAPPLPRNPQATGVGAIAHFSGLVSWVFGPLLVYGISSPGTPARRQAARAFNFQLVWGIAFVAAMVLSSILLPAMLVGAIATTSWLAWLLLTITGGAKALNGAEWQNPVMRAVRWEALDASGR